MLDESFCSGHICALMMTFPRVIKGECSSWHACRPNEGVAFTSAAHSVKATLQTSALHAKYLDVSLCPASQVELGNNSVGAAGEEGAVTMKDLQLVDHALDDVHYVDDVFWPVQVIHGPAQGTQRHFWVLLQRHGHRHYLHEKFSIGAIALGENS